MAKFGQTDTFLIANRWSKYGRIVLVVKSTHAFATTDVSAFDNKDI